MAEPANLLRHETSPYLLQHADNPVHWRPWGAAALARGGRGRQADHAVDRLRRVPLVPRHGARILRGPADRRADERAVRQHQGGSRGTPRHRPPLHVRAARAGRARRLAADDVPDAGRRRRSGAARISRRSRAGAGRRSARCCKASPRRIASATRWWRRTPARCAATCSRRRRRRAATCPAPAHLDAVANALSAHERRGAWRAEGRAEISQSADLPLPVAERLPHRRSGRPGRAAPDAATDVARRHLRPSRRRLFPLLDRRGLAGAAFREDAVRQRAIARAAGAGARPPPVAAVCRARRRDGRLDDTRHDRGTGRWPRRVRRLGRRRQRGRGRQILRLDRGGDRRAAGCRRARVQARLRRDAGRQLGRPHDPAPRHARRVRRRKKPRSRVPATYCSRRARKRVRPGRDDKVLADWNGLAIAALARAAVVFDQPEWLARAEEAFDFVLAQMGAPDGRVQHAWRLGRVTAAGLLDDQAAMARAALALFEATGDARATGAGGAPGRVRRRRISPTGMAGSTPRRTMRPTCRWHVRAPRRTTPRRPAPA